MIDHATERDEQIARILDEALSETQAGHAIDVASWQARYPDFANELAALLSTVRDLNTAVEDWKAASAATDTFVDGSTPVAQGDEQATATFQAYEPVPDAIGRYRILEQLGKGGMGTVYKAHDPQLDRVVALKVPRFDRSDQRRSIAVQRFLREARAAAKIRHPHVCPIYDVGEHEGCPYVVMAYVEGQSLDERLRRQGRFDDPAEAVTLARQVAEALDAVHAHGIIHRDLKPGNILLDSLGRAVLTDFGLARPENDTEHLTVDGAIVGTPAYMAPEQASGDADMIGPPTDLYSLGVVLFRMVTGKLPFEGARLALLNKIVHDPPPAPSGFRPGLDPAIDAICLKAMAKRPGERFQSGTQIATAIEACLKPLQAAPKPRNRRFMSTWLFAVGAAVALVAFGGVVYRISTDRGELEIHCHDASVEVTIKRNGKPVVERLEVSHGKAKTTVRSGDIEIVIQGDRADDFTVSSDHGGQPRFVLSRAGKAVVQIKRKSSVTAELAANDDPDRRAALWALANGAYRLDVDSRQQITSPDELPARPFRLGLITFNGVERNVTIDDSAANHLKDLRHLRRLALFHVSLSDAFFEQLASFPNLQSLSQLELQAPKLTGSVFKHLAKLRGLKALTVHGPGLCDNDLVALRDLCLTDLYLRANPAITGVGVRHLCDMKDLVAVALDETAVGDDGLAQLARMPTLKYISIANTPITDAGLAALAQHKKLTVLCLQGTRITDAGLEHLADLTQLLQLRLESTNVTATGVKKLRAALPQCRITSDLGTFGPNKAADTEADSTR